MLRIVFFLFAFAVVAIGIKPLSGEMGNIGKSLSELSFSSFFDDFSIKEWAKEREARRSGVIRSDLRERNARVLPVVETDSKAETQAPLEALSSSDKLELDSLIDSL